MKRLILVRHAKTEKIYPDITDFERQLTERGINDSQLIAKKIIEKDTVPQLLISSPAIRAKQTAEIFANSFNYPEENIYYQDFLYEFFTTNDILKLLAALGRENETVMIFGHNPTIAEVGFNLLRNFYDHTPTCFAMSIEFDNNNWNDIEPRKGDLGYFIFPKLFKPA